MKRFFSYTILALTLLLGGTACQQEQPKASSADFSVIEGISNRQLLLDGAEGAIKTFHIEAKWDWSILPTSGFLCNPSQGSAGTNIAIQATTLQANNSADTVALSELTFKLLNTRFVGIVAYQTPQVIIDNNSRRVVTEAQSGSIVTINFTSSSPDVEVRTSEGLQLVSSTLISGRRHEAKVKVLQRNDTAEESLAGTVSFYINDIKQGAVAEVWQESTIKLDRNSVLLSGYSGATTNLNVKSSYDFEVSSSSSNFEATKIGTNTVRITALVDNTTAEQVLLGTVRLSVPELGDCHTDIEVYQHPANTPQTLLFYYIGRSLSSYFNTNIENTMRALSQNIQHNSRVLIFIQSSATTAELYELRYDEAVGECVKELVKEYTIPGNYVEGRLTATLRDMIDYAPAKQYALIIGSHGKGWIPKSADSTLASVKALRESLWQQVEGALPTRHIGEGSATIFDTTQIAAELQATGTTFDYILLDNCFMSNIESLYDMRHTAKQFIASPTEVMASGFPYESILPLMLKDEGTGYDLAAICKTYYDYYMALSGTYQSASVALINASELDALAEKMKAVNSAERTPDFTLDGVQAYDGIGTRNPSHVFYDLEDYVRQSCADSEAVTAFKEQLAKAVTSRYHTPMFYSAYNGVLNDINYYSGISTSASVEVYADEWAKTEWYKATH